MDPQDKPLGVIEGFFGKAWEWSDRRALAPFLADHGYDFYIYAPKSDAHLRRRWTQQWPSQHVDELAALCDTFKRAGLGFGIGLSPMGAGDLAPGVLKAELKRAVQRVNEIGAHMLCVLFDDMRGDRANLAAFQASLVAEIAEASTALKILFCPTYYSFDPILPQTFGAMPDSYLSDLGLMLDREIDIFWTGEKVRSESYPPEHLKEVTELLGRQPFLWDNHLANDGAQSSQTLPLLSPLTRADLASEGTAGCAINPPNQPWLARLPLAMSAFAGRRGAAGEPSARFLAAARAECGERLAQTLFEDLPPLQDQGLEAMGEETRAALLEKYRTFKGSAFAREIVRFLEGAYAFDPACLTE
jgi:hyaluronoglucosaminidase